MARRPKLPDTLWPSWRYGPNGESAIFQSEADVPHGWTKKVQEVFTPRYPTHYDRGALATELHAQGVEIDPQWGAAQMKKVIDDLSSSR